MPVQGFNFEVYFQMRCLLPFVAPDIPPDPLVLTPPFDELEELEWLSETPPLFDAIAMVFFDTCFFMRSKITIV